MKNKVTRLHLLVDQFNLFVGTGCLLWMIRDVISLENFKPGTSQKLDELRILDEMLRRPVIHYWWIIGGLAVFQFFIRRGYDLVFDHGINRNVAVH